MLIKRLTNFSFKIVFSCLFLVAVLLIVSDIWAPFTTDATIQKRISNVTSQVNGIVQNVYVSNGEQVNKGDVLFSIEDQDYISLLASSKADYIITQQNIESLNAQLQSDKANLKIQHAEYNKVLHHFKRFKKLFNAHQISEDDFEQSKTDSELALAQIELAEANLQKTQASLGENKSNGQYLQAKANLERAQLNLERTKVKAKQAGIVTNLQLSTGDYVSNNTSPLLLVDNQHGWLIANFNEKGIKALSHSQKVLVVYDAFPGQVFEHRIDSIDYAVDTGVGIIGKASTTNTSERWIRKPQSFPARINIGNESHDLIAGSKATVMVVSEDNIFWRSFSQLVMHTISLLRYIY
ncbi:HlyD family secretion protein [Vibrio algivorus]|uniref:Hemolysin secretion protein D n=1 Tax=Vibrio algivorus TaxID=1667024 RepID=A0ABQ6EL12_9VIBR|nr:HlyD family secretion protein [Vibrio algivorus]GLT13808.1 hemolysin secretion protein D [Vibrio algivorus]